MYPLPFRLYYAKPQLIKAALNTSEMFHRRECEIPPKLKLLLGRASLGRSLVILHLYLPSLNLSFFIYCSRRSQITFLFLSSAFISSPSPIVSLLG